MCNLQEISYFRMFTIFEFHFKEEKTFLPVGREWSRDYCTLLKGMFNENVLKSPFQLCPEKTLASVYSCYNNPQNEINFADYNFSLNNEVKCFGHDP